jgi:hypothetical protein
MLGDGVEASGSNVNASPDKRVVGPAQMLPFPGNGDHLSSMKSAGCAPGDVPRARRPGWKNPAARVSAPNGAAAASTPGANVVAMHKAAKATAPGSVLRRIDGRRSAPVAIVGRVAGSELKQITAESRG